MSISSPVEAQPVSVVVPTRNRAPRLAHLIEALEQQEDAGAFDVVIVDDASTDATWSELTRLAAASSLPIAAIHLDENGGAAAARNVGWRAATGTSIAFTDDDCAPQPRWLRELVDGLADADIAQGKTLPNPAHADRLGPFAHTIVVTENSGNYETCNVAYRRSALEAVDGFDEGFRHPSGEDVDLGWRVRNAGGRTTFVGDAVVYHDVTAWGVLGDLREKRRRDGLVRAMSKHPPLRAEFGWFIRRSHAAAVAATVAGVAMARRPRRGRKAIAGAVGLWYAWTCRCAHHRPSRRIYWIAVVPVCYLLDLYEIAVVARAAVRYRTPVL
jgi:glycosyltransferase involved in cell wall biosynthesis